MKRPVREPYRVLMSRGEDSSPPASSRRPWWAWGVPAFWPKRPERFTCARLDTNRKTICCNRCQKCVQACPYGIVQPVPLSAAFMATGTPELTFKTGYCDFCMKCVDVCPTGALREGTPSYDDIGVAKVVSDACVAWDWAGCTVCVDECPVEGAITLDEHGRPIVDEDLCDGCGKCELKCPAASLRAYDSSTLEKGIYVVPRNCAVAQREGACTSDEMRAGRSILAEEASHA